MLVIIMSCMALLNHLKNMTKKLATKNRDIKSTI